MPEPAPMSKFDGAPVYMKSDIVAARRTDAAGFVEIEGGDVLEVAQGDWIVLTGETAFTVSDDVFRASHMPAFGGVAGQVDNNDFAPYATRGRKVRAVLVRGKIHAEGEFEPLDAKSFFAGVVRLDARGVSICPASAPLSVQDRALKGVDAVEHKKSLKTWRDKLAGNPMMAPEEALDIARYDAQSAHVKDTVDDFMASMNAALPMDGLKMSDDGTVESIDEDSILITLAKVVHDQPLMIMQLRNVHGYRDETTRALGRRLLGPFVGDFPMESVHMCPAPLGTTHPLEAWLSEGDLIEEVDGIVVPEMPSYVMSEIRHYRRDGVDAICVSDAMMSYVYAWPTPDAPGMKP